MARNADCVNNFAVWQPDEDLQNCLNCHTHFSFLVRKHHCRCCGGIFCGPCSEKLARYDTKRVRVVKRSESDEEYPPYRTCDSCYDNLLHLKLLLSPWGKRLELRDGSAMFGQRGVSTAQDDRSPAPSVEPSGTIKQSSESERTQEIPKSGSASVRRSAADDDPGCPICNFDLSKLANEEEAQNHVEDCLRKASDIQQHHGSASDIQSPSSHNRMLVYKVARNTDEHYTECPICFEDMLPGEKVGRLECLCIFHYKCIKSWFSKKAQKMKSKDAQYIGKNFCPLHDAVF